jgi:hypothetical protein
MSEMIPELLPLYVLLEDSSAGFTGVICNYTSKEEFVKITNIPEMQLVYGAN